MRKLNTKKLASYLLAMVFLLLTSCGKHTGLRTPLYDGEPIKPNEAAIEVYQSTAEVTGAEKEFYLRHSFSEDILQESLDYPNEEPFLLEEGCYVIGEDLPAGRATLLGNESSFSIENYDVHVGNLMVRDGKGAIYYENLFHSEYGQLTAQFDLISGHEIIIIGQESEITVFYENSLPKNPYVLMELPESIKNLDLKEVQQPLETFEEEMVVHLSAGIYEVGRHLKAGEYMLSDLMASHSTEMLLFREQSSPRVIELLMDAPPDLEISKGLEDKVKSKEGGVAKVELLDGDKIYLSLVKKLKLNRLEGE